MGERLKRFSEKVRENKPETFVLAMGAAALAWEAVVPDKSHDLISHAADRHQLATLIGSAILIPHLLNVYERLGVPELDVISHLGKRFSGSEVGDVQV